MVRKIYIGKDGLVRRIAGRVTWTRGAEAPAKQEAAADASERATFDLKVGAYRRPVVFPPRPDSQPPTRIITLSQKIAHSFTPPALSQDGRLIALCTMDGNIRLLDGQTGKELSVLKGHHSQLTSVAFSPDGKRLVTADDIGISVWDVETLKPTVTFRDRPDAADMTVLPDGRSAIFSNHIGVQVIDLERGQTLHALQQFVSSGMTLSPDGGMAAIPSPGKLTLWNIRTRQTVAFETELTASRCPAAFSPDGARLATVDRDKTVKIRDAQTGRVLQELKGGAGHALLLWFDSDGQTVTALDQDERDEIPNTATGLTTWELASGAVIRPLTLKNADFVIGGGGLESTNTVLMNDLLMQVYPGSNRIRLWSLLILPAGHVSVLK